MLFRSGLHGLDVLRQETPQVVITDINMPRMDGFGFIEAVRQVRGEAHPHVQVPDCDVALAHGTGGLLGSRMGSATLILGNQDA